MPSHSLALLANAAGESLRSIKLDFRPDLPVPPNILTLFKQLVNLDMTHSCPLSSDTTGLEPDTLATLQELHINSSSSFLRTLTVLRSAIFLPFPRIST